MNKKILVVGKFSTNPNIYTYATSFYKTFLQLGFDTQYIDSAPTWPLQHNPVINKITRPLIITVANNAVLQAVKKHSPFMVFILKGQYLTPQTIQAIKATGTRIVHFYPDNPFSLWNSNSSEYVLKSLPLIDCFLSWSPILTPALLASGSPHVCDFPFAYDESIYNDTPLFLGHKGPAPFDELRVSGDGIQINTDTKSKNAESPLLLSLSKDEVQRARKSALVDVCFIGTWEPEREKILEQVIKRLPSVSFGIWGNLWAQHAQSPHVKKFVQGNAIYEQTMIDIYHHAKIILNFLRAQNTEAHNMRTFEVPATKSFLLTERTQQQAELFFKEDYSIACFTGIDELVEKINTYLHDTPARKLISERSFVAAQDYTLHKQLRNYIDKCPALR